MNELHLKKTFIPEIYWSFFMYTDHILYILVLPHMTDKLVETDSEDNK